MINHPVNGMANNAPIEEDSKTNPEYTVVDSKLILNAGSRKVILRERKPFREER